MAKSNRALPKNRSTYQIKILLDTDKHSKVIGIVYRDRKIESKKFKTTISLPKGVDVLFRLAFGVKGSLKPFIEEILDNDRVRNLDLLKVMSLSQFVSILLAEKIAAKKFKVAPEKFRYAIDALDSKYRNWNRQKEAIS